MGITPHLVLRGTKYYFRMAVPRHLVKKVGRAEVSTSLRTVRGIGREAPLRAYYSRSQIPTDVMRIAPLAETATPRGLCVGDTQFLRSISQIPTKRIHENVLFWKSGTRHELIGVMDKPILFLRGFE